MLLFTSFPYSFRWLGWGHELWIWIQFLYFSPSFLTFFLSPVFFLTLFLFRFFYPAKDSISWWLIFLTFSSNLFTLFCLSRLFLFHINLPFQLFSPLYSSNKVYKIIDMLIFFFHFYLFIHLFSFSVFLSKLFSLSFYCRICLIFFLF